MNTEIINSCIGSLLVKEKYKFIQDELLGEIVRDFINEYDKENANK